MEGYKNLVLERKDKSLIIYLNRPDKLNVLNKDLMDELYRVFYEEINRDVNMEGFIITGTGEKAFSAGADIGELSKLNGPAGLDFSLYGQKLFYEIENCGKASIAAINGVAFGGGLELAMSCTFRFAVETVKIGQPEVRLGIIPGYGGTQRLLRLVGTSRAAELILSGEGIDAKKAYEYGLVNRITNKENLISESFNFLKKIYSNGPIAIKYALSAINYGKNTNLENALLLESLFFSTVTTSQDSKEGLDAFLQKRKPEFKNK